MTLVGVSSENRVTPQERAAAALDRIKTELPDVACASLSLQLLLGLCGLGAQRGAWLAGGESGDSFRFPKRSEWTALVSKFSVLAYCPCVLGLVQTFSQHSHTYICTHTHLYLCIYTCGYICACISVFRLLFWPERNLAVVTWNCFFFFCGKAH